MNRRNMILTLALAALLPSSLLCANSKPATPFCLPGHSTTDRQLTRTITALEKSSWEAGMCYNWEAAEALYANEFVEVLADGSLFTKKQLVQDLKDQAWVITEFTMPASEICVVRLSESSALIRYRIVATFDFGPDELGDPILMTFNLMVTSTYAQVWGQWKAFSYQETEIAP
jgi:hypothetical protein